jgi:DNA-directed RNA polymerase specialized sigma24 family protein
MSQFHFPLAGARLCAFENIQSRLARTRSSFWDAVYSRALDALLNEKWRPTGPAEAVARSAISNAKKTVSRRESKTVPWREIEKSAASPDCEAEVHAYMDVASLLRQAPKLDRAVLELRLAGKEDSEIAGELGALPKQVPVLHYRALKRLQKKLNKEGLSCGSLATSSAQKEALTRAAKCQR